MKQLMISGVFLALFFASVVSAGGDAPAKSHVSPDLGIVPIGGLPSNLRIFVMSDCGAQQPKFADCSAEDAQGREYVFFGGALSIVSTTQKKAAKSLRLPAGLKFGEPIDQAAEKARKAFSVKLDKDTTREGKTFYSSDFAIKSSKGVSFSIELIADEKERLNEIVERTDF